MKLLLDHDATRRFDFIRPEIVRGEVRSYYCTKRDDDHLALIVVRGNRLLPDLAGRVVDAAIGLDSGYPGYVHITSRTHRKITIFGVIDGEPETTLANVLANAPKRRI